MPRLMCLWRRKTADETVADPDALLELQPLWGGLPPLQAALFSRF